MSEAADTPKKNTLEYQKGNFEFMQLTLLNKMAIKLDNIDNNIVAAVEVGEDILKELKKLNKSKEDIGL